MAPFARIKLAQGGAEPFAEVNIVEGDTVSRLVERACVKFSHWGVNAAQVTLFLVAHEGDDLPLPAAEECARLVDQIGWSPARAGIVSGSWLVARRLSTSACLPALQSPSSGSLVSHAQARGPLLDSADQQDNADLRGDAAQVRAHEPRDHVLSPLPLGHVAQIALVSARHWLTNALQRLGASFFSPPPSVDGSGVCASRSSVVCGPLVPRGQPLGGGAELPQRTLHFGGADVVVGASEGEGLGMKED